MPDKVTTSMVINSRTWENMEKLVTNSKHTRGGGMTRTGLVRHILDQVMNAIGKDDGVFLEASGEWEYDLNITITIG